MFRGGSSDCMVHQREMVGTIRQQNRDAVMGLCLGVDSSVRHHNDDSGAAFMEIR